MGPQTIGLASFSYDMFLGYAIFSYIFKTSLMPGPGWAEDLAYDFRAPLAFLVILRGLV